MKTENVSTLKIHKLTQAQYDRELAAGRIDENALYLTPDDTNNMSGSLNGIIVSIDAGSWILQENGTYTNTVLVDGLTGDEILDVNLYGDVTEEQSEAFDVLVKSIDTQEGCIVLTASEEIDVEFKLLLRGKINFEEQKAILVKDLNSSNIVYDNSKSKLPATNVQQAIDRLSNLSNPNLFINGDFRVWQRGTNITGYSDKAVYTSDRWQIYMMCNAKNNNGAGLKLEFTDEDYGPLCQFVEIAPEMYDFFVNKPLTLSFRMRTSRDFNLNAGLDGKFKPYSTKTNQIETHKITFTPVAEDFKQLDTGYALKVNVIRLSSTHAERFRAGDVIEVLWAKLEFGEVATPFIPRLYAEELELCRRYFSRDYVTAIRTYKYSDTKYLFECSVPQLRIEQPTVNYISSTCYTTSGIQSLTHEGAGFRSSGLSGDNTVIYFILSGYSLDTHVTGCCVYFTRDAEIY